MSVKNQKFYGFAAPFTATHASRGAGRVDYISPSGRAFFIRSGKTKGKFVNFSELKVQLPTESDLPYGDLTLDQQKEFKRAAANGAQVLFFNTRRRRWMKAAHPTWKNTTRYRVTVG